jgi:hypothetical protein
VFWDAEATSAADDSVVAAWRVPAAAWPAWLTHVAAAVIYWDKSDEGRLTPSDDGSPGTRWWVDRLSAFFPPAYAGCPPRPIRADPMLFITPGGRRVRFDWSRGAGVEANSALAALPTDINPEVLDMCDAARRVYGPARGRLDQTAPTGGSVSTTTPGEQ